MGLKKEGKKGKKESRGSGHETKLLLESKFFFTGIGDPNNHWNLVILKDEGEGKRSRFEKYKVQRLSKSERRNVKKVTYLNWINAIVNSEDTGRIHLSLLLSNWVENDTASPRSNEYAKMSHIIRKYEIEMAFQNYTDQCKFKSAFEGAETIKVAQKGLEVCFLNGDVLGNLGKAMANQSKNIGYILIDTVIGAIDNGVSFNADMLNRYLMKIQTNKAIDLESKMIDDLTVFVRCTTYSSHFTTQLLQRHGYSHIQTFFVFIHDLNPRKRGCLSDIFVSSKHPEIRSGPIVLRSERNTDVMDHLCRTFIDVRSNVLIVHGGSGADACAIVHNGCNVIQLNSSDTITNLAKCRLQKFLSSSPEEQVIDMRTKFHPTLSSISSLHAFGTYWKQCGITEGKTKLQDDTKHSSTRSSSPISILSPVAGKKRPGPLVKQSPAKKQKSLNRRDSSAGICSSTACKNTLLPSEIRRCYECQQDFCKACCHLKSKNLKTGFFCSAICLKAFDDIVAARHS
ncbi:hypothetical protein AAMO2058_001245300 [Amorphochlora amoebiformis]